MVWGIIYSTQQYFNMNFLAHILLSGDDERIMVGNFIGDFVKGSQLDNFDQKIQEGIRLHRSIDTFTDNHPVVLESKKRLRPVFRHYAPVIVDVFYDHFLAKDWSKFSKEPLLEFTHWFYNTMNKYTSTIPEAVSNTLIYMASGNWLYHYQFIEGIDRALKGMSRKTKFNSKMEIASSFLEQDYDLFEKEFNQFFPDLQRHVGNFEK